jgi:hypothetical protein
MAMDKHVIQTREEQLDWVESLEPTHIQTNQHEAENISLEADTAFFSPRNLVSPTLVVGTTRVGKTRLREDYYLRPTIRQEGV